MQLLDRIVRPVLTYCLGSLTLTLDHLKQLRWAQQQMHIRMLGKIKVPENFQVDDYMWKRGHKIKHAKQEWGIKNWDEEYFSLCYRWAGHVARMRQYDDQRIVYKISQYQNFAYLTALEEELGAQCHVGRFHVWRWERQFYKLMGPYWYHAAAESSKQDWLNAQEKWQDKRRFLR